MDTIPDEFKELVTSFSHKGLYNVEKKIHFDSVVNESAIILETRDIPCIGGDIEMSQKYFEACHVWRNEVVNGTTDQTVEYRFNHFNLMAESFKHVPDKAQIVKYVSSYGYLRPTAQTIFFRGTRGKDRKQFLHVKRCAKLLASSFLQPEIPSLVTSWVTWINSLMLPITLACPQAFINSRPTPWSTKAYYTLAMGTLPSAETEEKLTTLIGAVKNYKKMMLWHTLLDKTYPTWDELINVAGVNMQLPFIGGKDFHLMYLGALMHDNYHTKLRFARLLMQGRGSTAATEKMKDASLHKWKTTLTTAPEEVSDDTHEWVARHARDVGVEAAAHISAHEDGFILKTLLNTSSKIGSTRAQEGTTGCVKKILAYCQKQPPKEIDLCTGDETGELVDPEKEPSKAILMYCLAKMPEALANPNNEIFEILMLSVIEISKSRSASISHPILAFLLSYVGEIALEGMKGVEECKAAMEGGALGYRFLNSLEKEDWIFEQPELLELFFGDLEEATDKGVWEIGKTLLQSYFALEIYEPIRYLIDIAIDLHCHSRWCSGKDKTKITTKRAWLMGDGLTKSVLFLANTVCKRRAYELTIEERPDLLPTLRVRCDFNGDDQLLLANSQGTNLMKHFTSAIKEIQLVASYFDTGVSNYASGLAGIYSEEIFTIPLEKRRIPKLAMRSHCAYITTEILVPKLKLLVPYRKGTEDSWYCDADKRVSSLSEQNGYYNSNAWCRCWHDFCTVYAVVNNRWDDVGGIPSLPTTFYGNGVAINGSLRSTVSLNVWLAQERGKKFPWKKCEYLIDILRQWLKNPEMDIAHLKPDDEGDFYSTDMLTTYYMRDDLHPKAQTVTAQIYNLIGEIPENKILAQQKAKVGGIGTEALTFALLKTGEYLRESQVLDKLRHMESMCNILWPVANCANEVDTSKILVPTYDPPTSTKDDILYKLSFLSIIRRFFPVAFRNLRKEKLYPASYIPEIEIAKLSFKIPFVGFGISEHEKTVRSIEKSENARKLRDAIADENFEVVTAISQEYRISADELIVNQMYVANKRCERVLFVSTDKAQVTFFQIKYPELQILLIFPKWFCAYVLTRLLERLSSATDQVSEDELDTFIARFNTNDARAIRMVRNFIQPELEELVRGVDDDYEFTVSVDGGSINGELLNMTVQLDEKGELEILRMDPHGVNASQTDWNKFTAARSRKCNMNFNRELDRVVRFIEGTLAPMEY